MEKFSNAIIISNLFHRCVLFPPSSLDLSFENTRKGCGLEFSFILQKKKKKLLVHYCVKIVQLENLISKKYFKTIFKLKTYFTVFSFLDIIFPFHVNVNVRTFGRRKVRRLKFFLFQKKKKVKLIQNFYQNRLLYILKTYILEIFSIDSKSVNYERVP